jgi:predicted transcriptional regulator
MNLHKIISWDVRESEIKFCAGFLKSVPGDGASKTHIIYNSNLNFRTVGPYIELLTKNGLAVRVDGTPTRYKTTAKGEEALRCFRELEELDP